MAKITVEKNRTTMLEITTSNNTVSVEKSNTFNSQSHGIVESGSVSGNHYAIDGTVIGNGSGHNALSFDGAGTSVSIGEHGKLKGEYWAVRAFGDDSRIVNDGKIDGTLAGLGIAGEDMHVINRGSILSANGYAVTTDNLAKLRLDNDGLMDSADGLNFRVENLTLNLGKNSVVEFGQQGAIETNSLDGWVARINNKGEITNTDTGMINAISGGAGSELVRNSGSITGFVSLDAGDDRYDGRGGRIHDGTVFGGEGNDTYLISNSRDRVHDSAGWGYDTLKVSCSYDLGDNNEIEVARLMGNGDFKLTGNALDNYLQGNKGDNVLLGKAGFDALWGGAGDDVMTGGADSDIFNFKANSDREVITDFTDGEDFLVLFDGKQIKSIADLLAHHVEQDGKDLVISGDGTEMILKHFDKADLSLDDFAV